MAAQRPVNRQIRWTVHQQRPLNYHNCFLSWPGRNEIALTEATATPRKRAS